MYKTTFLLCIFILGCTLQPARSQEAVPDFAVVKNILASACVNCHGAKEAEGDLRLDTMQGAMEALVPGKPEESSLYTTMILPPDHDELMPPEAPLDKTQTELIRKWIVGGAKWESEKPLRMQPRVDFVKNIQPILEQQCVCLLYTSPSPRD